MSNGGILIVGAFDNGVNWAGLLTEATIDTFGHVNVIASCSSGTVRSGLAFDGDGVGGTGSSA